MLLLDKTRALDRMVWLSQAHQNAVPLEFLRPAVPVRWSRDVEGRRILTAEVVFGRGTLVLEAPGQRLASEIVASPGMASEPASTSRLITRRLAPITTP